MGRAMSCRDVQGILRTQGGPVVVVFLNLLVVAILCKDCSPRVPVPKTVANNVVDTLRTPLRRISLGHALPLTPPPPPRSSDPKVIRLIFFLERKGFATDIEPKPGGCGWHRLFGADVKTRR